MATITPADMADLIIATRRDLGELRFQQIAQDITNYEVFSRWFRQGKVMFESGYGIQRTLMGTYDSSAARHVGYTATDQVNIADVLTTMRVDYVHATTSYGIIYQTDILMNRGKNIVLNVIQPKRCSALLALVVDLEDKAWGDAPTTTNKVDPFGIQYWIVENATTGFNGGLASDHTTCANVNLTTYPNFKNYTAQYTNVTKDDLIKKLRTAHRKIQFKSPVSVPDYRGATGANYRLYVNEATISSIEDLGEAQNENLGRDIASMDGQMTFLRNPIVYVPKLDDRTDNPVYMIDHTTFYPVCLKGDYLRESDPECADSQHNVFQVFIDLSYNYICVDRRRNAVLSTG